MIFMSLITCVASAVALVAVGGASKYGLYAGTGKFKNEFKMYIRSTENNKTWLLMT